MSWAFEVATSVVRDGRVCFWGGFSLGLSVLVLASFVCFCRVMGGMGVVDL